MKNTLCVLSLLFLLAGCNLREPNHQKTVNDYYSAFDSGSYDDIRLLINDDITIVAGDYATPYTHDSFYEFFKWDSVFRPSYEILELQEKDSHVLVTVTQKNIRNEFLKNNPLTYRVKVSFISGKISKLEEVESIGVDWSIWAKERDSLVDYIANNHPELDGFVYDMTMGGAMDYLEAIDLYTTYKESPTGQ